jgi:hypothetical protein
MRSDKRISAHVKAIPSDPCLLYSLFSPSSPLSSIVLKYFVARAFAIGIFSFCICEFFHAPTLSRHRTFANRCLHLQQSEYMAEQPRLSSARLFTRYVILNLASLLNFRIRSLLNIHRIAVSQRAPFAQGAAAIE